MSDESDEPRVRLTTLLTDPKPRRRWFRFSLRSLLIFTVLIGLLMGWIAKERKQSHQEQQTAAWLQEQGRILPDAQCRFTHRLMTVSFGGPYDEWRPRKTPPHWWHGLARKVLGERIVEVAALKPAFKDLTPLARLTSLNWLQLEGDYIRDITPLAGLRNLQVLTLEGTQVNDVSPLARLTKLQFLDLGITPVKDITPLAELTNLQDLDLDLTQVSDLEALRGMANLKSLALRGTKVTDLTPLQGLKNLRRLYIDSRQARGPQMVATPVTREQIEVLQKALPSCQIKHDLFP